MPVPSWASLSSARPAAIADHSSINSSSDIIDTATRTARPVARSTSGMLPCSTIASTTSKSSLPDCNMQRLPPANWSVDSIRGNPKRNGPVRVCWRCERSHRTRRSLWIYSLNSNWALICWPSWKRTFTIRMPRSWFISCLLLWHWLWMHRTMLITVRIFLDGLSIRCWRERQSICFAIVWRAKRPSCGDRWVRSGLFLEISGKVNLDILSEILEAKVNTMLILRRLCRLVPSGILWWMVTRVSCNRWPWRWICVTRSK